MLSQDYIMGKLNEFVKSDKGKKFLRDKGIYAGVTKQEAKRMAKSLLTRLINASKQITASQDSLFPSVNLVEITEPKQGTDGSYSININFAAGSFYRESLVSKKTGAFIGVGAYDIVGLFTHGYAADRYVSGIWRYKDTFVKSHSISKGKPGLKPHNFVDKAVNSFIQTYEKKNKNLKITVNYPSLWHS